MKTVASLQTITFSVIVSQWEHIPRQCIQRLPKELLTMLVERFTREKKLSFGVLKWLEGSEFQFLNLSGQGGKVNDEWMTLISSLILDKLSLNNCRQLTDEGLYKLTSSSVDLHKDSPLTGSLQELDLSGNGQLSNTGIEALSYFRALETLVLDYCCSLGNVSLSYIRELPCLKSLSLVCCDKISGSGLELLFGSRNLEFLNLSGCSRITSDALVHIGNLKNLRHLKLRCCSRIDNRALEYIGKLKSLETLELYDCVKIDDDGLKFLEKCSQMRHLCLSGTSISASGLVSLETMFMPYLESLHLTRCSHLVASPFSLALRKLSKNLKKLQLRYLYCVNEEVLRAISESFPRLESLNLTDCRHVNDSGISFLKIMPSLCILKLGGTSISDNGILLITNLSRRTSEFDISSCAFCSDRIMMHILNNVQCLSILDVSHNPTFTKASWRPPRHYFPERLPLKTLVLEDGGQLGERFLTSIAYLFPHLETLLLSKCCIASEDFRAFSDFRHLKHLKLFQCEVSKPINYEWMIPLKETLQYLNLSSCNFVTDDFCKVIGDLVHLESLHLKNCRSITNRALLSLYSLTQLSYLNLRGCPLLSQEYVWLLEQNLPAISMLKYDTADCTSMHQITRSCLRGYYSSSPNVYTFEEQLSRNREQRKHNHRSLFLASSSPCDVSNDEDYKNAKSVAFIRTRRRQKNSNSPCGKQSKFFLYMDSIELFEP